jgi:predicted CopG family antitoxin
MTQSASPNNSDMVSIRVSRATQEKLKKLKKGNMTYDDVISQMVDDENWDVEKLDADLDTIEKKSKFYTFEEVFKGV